LQPEGATASRIRPADFLDDAIPFGISAPRRIAILSPTGSLYGAGRSLLELVASLRQMELEVGVILPREAMVGPALQSLRCRLWPMHIPSWVQIRTEHSKTDPGFHGFAAASSHLCKEMENWKPDLLWTNSTVSPVGALAARMLGIPHLWHLRELIGREYHHEFSVGEIAAIELINSAKTRVAVSRAVKSHYEGLGGGLCEWVYNGIGAVNRLVEQRASRTGDGLSRLVIVGQVCTFKKTATAIEATAILQDMGHPVKLRVVGDGEIENCRRLAIRMGVSDRVEFTGFTERVDEHYRWADIALSCAGHEAMGRATAEAMSWGLPIAGHRAAGTGELVSQAGCGLLYDGSAAELARVIAVLIENPAEAERMGEAGRCWAKAHVSSEQHAGRIREIIESISREIAPQIPARHYAAK